MSKWTLSLLACACTLVAATPALAAGDDDAGKTKSEACVDCHGDDGKGDEDNPSIAGMAIAEFTRALVEYQDGTRTDKMMVKAAKKLNATDVADLASYYATLTP